MVAMNTKLEVENFKRKEGMLLKMVFACIFLMPSMIMYQLYEAEHERYMELSETVGKDAITLKVASVFQEDILSRLQECADNEVLLDILQDDALCVCDGGNRTLARSSSIHPRKRTLSKDPPEPQKRTGFYTEPKKSEPRDPPRDRKGTGMGNYGEPMRTDDPKDPPRKGKSTGQSPPIIYDKNILVGTKSIL